MRRQIVSDFLFVIIVVLWGHGGILFSVRLLNSCLSPVPSCVLVRDHELCGFPSLMGPIPIIYLTVTLYHDPSSLPFSRSLLLNCPSNGKPAFLLNCNECSNYAEGDGGEFPMIDGVIGSPTLSPSLSLRSSSIPTDLWSALAAGEETKPPLVVMHPLSALPSRAPMRWLQN